MIRSQLTTSAPKITYGTALRQTNNLAKIAAAQVRRVVENPIDMRRSQQGDRDILTVNDTGHNAPRMTQLPGRSRWRGGPRAWPSTWRDRSGIEKPRPLPGP